jgi:hypothetical protein
MFPLCLLMFSRNIRVKKHKPFMTLIPGCFKAKQCLCLLMFTLMFTLMFAFHDPYVSANIREWTPTDVVE